MEVTTISQQRATMPSGASKVLDRRSLENDYKSLVPFLKEGMRVLDVGCGTGSITRGIAERVGLTGRVIGIDVSSDLIGQANLNHRNLSNLSFLRQNIFSYEPEEKFDLIMSARTLQWLSNPVEALMKMKSMLKSGGIISILDYNHEKAEWQPTLPDSMKSFYHKFLSWRQDVGMNNRIADELDTMLASVGLKGIQVEDASELNSIDEVEFIEVAGIWTKVAELRGPQMVQDGYVTDQERLAAIRDYTIWLEEVGQSMTLYLRAVSGRND